MTPKRPCRRITYLKDSKTVRGLEPEISIYDKNWSYFRCDLSLSLPESVPSPSDRRGGVGGSVRAPVALFLTGPWDVQYYRGTIGDLQDPVLHWS